MEKLKTPAKFILFITLLSGVLWLGSYTSRLFLTFQLFQPKNLSFKSYINVTNLPGILTTLTPIISFTFICYIVFLIAFTLFLIVSKISLKKEGWLFITLLIIYITAPFELFLMTLDWKTIMILLTDNFKAEEITPLVIKRLSILSSFSLIEIFSFVGIIFLTVFKPLRIKA
jgi:hypothetical protein